jgi:tetratricopeptide (TPR) repeat protein
VSAADDHNDRALRLFARGRFREAREHLDEAVRLYREAPSAGVPTEFALAGALHNRAKCLTELGIRDDARRDARDAVAIMRKCARIDRESTEPFLARALSQVAVLLLLDVRPRMAAKAAREAVAISRRVAEASDARAPDARSAAAHDRETPDRITLAMALNNLSLCLWHLGRHEQRLAAIEEAVSIYESAARDHKAWEPLLAEGLDNLGVARQAVGRGPEALDAARRSVALYKSMSASHTPDLTGALFNLSNHLDLAGRRDEAAQRMRQVVQAYRELAAREPARYGPDLERAERALDDLRNGCSPLR